ncbi:sensor histidine kinase [Nocardiopsis sp. RSe5-2]|uniref:histidine kinase n=1 Tax=Nocardiopsis endophytica TaxID=3018445 RepID=A0ABT4U834_9ACTN|nr:sensor histidine kinase [Nocardiopsis endophytica]MDA2813118.1 sensor histidine kinase [Nocardiopsis endophytica]
MEGLKWTRLPVAVVLGTATALAGLLVLAAAVPALAVASPFPSARHRVAAWVRRSAGRLVGLERRRFSAFGLPSPAGPAPDSTPRAFGYLASRALPGALGALTVGLLAIGTVLALIVLVAVLHGRVDLPEPVVRALSHDAASGSSDTGMGLLEFLGQVVIGAALLMLNLQAMASVTALDRRMSAAYLAPSERERLERRVSELAESRAGVITAVDAERRRIERDLHDGLQQRLVALGMLLGRALRSDDPERAAELVAQARESTGLAVEELREVAWRVYPSELDSAGLEKVLALLAERSSLPVEVDCDLPVRPAPEVETVLYFVVSEAVTNAAKHAGAGLVTVRISEEDGMVTARVRDDGAGGADPEGAGLSGLARRVAALDGTFAVDSPAGGPTELRAVLPCG